MRRVGVSRLTDTVFPQPNRYRDRVPLPSLGRSRSKSASPRRAPADQLAPDTELESYLAAIAPEADVETTASGRRFGNAEVYQLRLSLIANEQLRELAAHRQTSPHALAQEWVMERLSWEAQQLRYPQS
ncbi:hypothetical protein KIPE111705_09275 [Kibdelosporangium persicum]|uniref:CopG family transcriptional regulator n=1 Tax=Kibdelosporangium persicum TaxID=2698649 RepID=A0ABX2FBE6_9PSEU|nr:hypothetical protein [Kibdelosporangium persicum]